LAVALRSKGLKISKILPAFDLSAFVLSPNLDKPEKTKNKRQNSNKFKISMLKIQNQDLINVLRFI